MWEIWANLLLPKALKSCPKYKKSPNLVTLHASYTLSGPKAASEFRLSWGTFKFNISFYTSPTLVAIIEVTIAHGPSHLSQQHGGFQHTVLRL